MVAKRLLFLGYGLRDWNLRVLLDRLVRLRSSTRPLKSYAITHGVTEVERILWDRRSIAVYDADLNAFISKLKTKLAPFIPAGAS